MARDLVALIPVLLVLYGTFLLGQVNQRRKYADRRDPLPVIAAARTVLAEREVRGDGGISEGAAGGLRVALDKWDLTPQ